MNSLDELLHPITLVGFEADYEGRKPLHIPAQADTLKLGAHAYPTPP